MTSHDVLIVLFDGVQSLDVTGPLEVFATATDLAAAQGGRPDAYRVRTAALGGEAVRTSAGLRLLPDEDLRTAAAPDILIVPGGHGTHPADPDVVARIAGLAPAAGRAAAGVSAGIDLALHLAGRIAGDAVAEAIQLVVEYDPEPPYACGSVSAAPPELVSDLRASELVVHPR